MPIFKKIVHHFYINISKYLNSYKILIFSKVILGFSIMILLLNEVDKFKVAFKNTYLFMQANSLTFGLKFEDILYFSDQIRILSIFYILIFILCIFLFKIIKKIIDKSVNHRPNFTNPFESSLFNYLNNEDDKRTYLVTGKWGSGKTYIVSNFLKKFFRFSDRNIYYISCFGLESREQVLKEVKEQLELNDNSFLKLLQFFPVIGKPIYSLFKQSYSLSTIKRNSIFIFDDFERISSIGLKTTSTRSRPRKSSSSLNRRTNIKGFEDVNEEFDKIKGDISRLQKREEEIYYLENYQKYNVVTGFINELVETYNQKVIILCNVDILGHEFVDTIFRGKLDCITYPKTVDSQTMTNLTNQTLNNQVFSDNDIKNRITEVVHLVSQDFENIIEAYGETNLRHSKSIFQSFVETAELVLVKNKQQVSDDYLISLFYSIVTVKFLTNERRIKYLDYMNTGGSLLFYLKLYNDMLNDDFINALSNSKYISTLRWTGIEISAYWLLNLTTPQEIQNLINEYNNYTYTNIECEIIFDEKEEILNEDILLEHIFYLMESSRTKGTEKEMSEKVISYLQSNNIESLILPRGILDNLNNEEGVYFILDKIQAITRSSIYGNVFKEILIKIYNRYGIEEIEGTSHIYEEYNRVAQEQRDK